MKNRFVFLTRLLCTFFILGRSMAQDNVSFGAIEVNAPSKNFTYSSNQAGYGFSIATAFKYNTKFYKNYSIVVTAPVGIDYDGSIPITENNLILSSTVTGGGTSPKVVTFWVDNSKLSPLEQDFSVSVIFTGFRNNIANLSCTADISNDISFQVKAENKTCASACTAYLIGQDKSTVTVNKRTDDLGFGISISSGRLMPTTNYLAAAYSDIVVHAGGVYSNIKVKIEYPSSVVDYLQISEYNDDQFNFNSSTTSRFSNLNNSNGVLTFDLIGGNYIRFRVYYRSKVTQNASFAVKVTANANKTPCGASPEAYNTSVEKSDIFSLDNTVLGALKPAISIKDYQWNICASNCNFLDNQSYLRFETNNIYNPASSPYTSFIINVPVGVKITKLKLDDLSQFGGVMPICTLKLRSKTVTETPQTIPSNGELSVSVSDIEYIKVSSIGLGAQLAKDFILYYSHVIPSTVKNFSIAYFDGGQNYGLVDVNSDPNLGGTCNNNSYVYDWYSPSTFALNGLGYVVLRLSPADAQYPDTEYNFNFDYTLNNYMEFTGSTLKFMKSGVDNDFKTNGSSYSSTLNSILASTTDWSIGAGGFVKIIGKNKISIVGLKLKNLCSNSSQKPYLYILAQVKIGAKVPNAYYKSNFVASQNQTDIQFYYNYWNVPLFFKLSASAFVTCNGLNYTSGNVKKGDVVSMRYAIYNTSTGTLNNFKIAGQTLGFGTQNLVPTEIKYYLLNENSSLVGSVQYLTPSQVVDGYGQINTIISNVSLSGFGQLIVDFKYTIPQSLNLNVQNISFFKVKASESNEITSTPMDITISDNSICGEVVDPATCAECITSLSPLPGQRYLLSAWVKESYTGILPKTYVNSGVQITFNNGAIADLPLFRPTGPVVDGWQRIESSFVVPTNANNIQIELVNESEQIQVYFDDVRIHPFRSNMKSFVYDPSSQRLTAELDENNYATMYEYDDEGILIRVKKETERGVMTIKESRNNQSKIFK